MSESGPRHWAGGDPEPIRPAPTEPPRPSPQGGPPQRTHFAIIVGIAVLFGGLTSAAIVWTIAPSHPRNCTVKVHPGETVVIHNIRGHCEVDALTQQ